MKAFVVQKTASEFTTSDGTLLKGFNITIFRDSLDCKTYWVAADKLALMGFVDKMVANPFNNEKLVAVEVNFDEKAGFGGKPSKIVPTSFRPV